MNFCHECLYLQNGTRLYSAVHAWCFGKNTDIDIKLSRQFFPVNAYFKYFLTELLCFKPMCSKRVFYEAY